MRRSLSAFFPAFGLAATFFVLQGCQPDDRQVSNAGQQSATQQGTAGGADTESQVAASLSLPQQNAIRSAKSYLDLKGFSRQGLIDQLSSDYGDRYPVSDATFAVDSLKVDWDAQAVRAAESYLSLKGFSCDGLIQQLSSSYGDKFTESQATYGAKQSGACG